MITLVNEGIEAAISTHGAELKSVLCHGRELIWQGNESIWARSAPVLFPVVGKPFNDELLIDGTLYPMPQHGFARDMVFGIFERNESSCVLRLLSDASTRKVYPYDFDLRLRYTLNGNSIECGYEVKNTGTKPMYFSIGGHPGFNLPEKDMSRYVIAFEKVENTPRYLLENGLLNGKSEVILDGRDTLDLDRKLFDKDAIVLKNLRSKKLALRSREGSLKIEMSWEDFPFFGIWSKQGFEEFICLEPWCGIAGTAGKQVRIEEKEGMNMLEAGEVFNRKYTVTFDV